MNRGVRTRASGLADDAERFGCGRWVIEELLSDLVGMLLGDDFLQPTSDCLTHLSGFLR